MMTFEEQTEAIRGALEAGKAEDVRVYDMRGASGLADAFIVATGLASPHLKALAAAVEKAAAGCGAPVYRTSGDPDSGWIAIDCVDAVVHIFSPEARAYYALEKLWERK